MFEGLKRSLSATELTVADTLIAESGNGEFANEDTIMRAILKEEQDNDDYDDDIEYDEDDELDDFLSDYDDEELDEACKKKNRTKKLKEEYQEIKRLVEEVTVSDEDDAANDYLESIANGSDDSEIENLVNSIPVDGDEPITGTDDDLETEAGNSVEDPTIEELADALENEYY